MKVFPSASVHAVRHHRERLMCKTIGIAVLAALLASCASEEERVEKEGMVADGRAIAETQCASCHAVGVSGQSAAQGAPPFRYVLSRYDGASLTENLVEGIRVAHAMPEFQFDPKGADALIAYLGTIQSTAPPGDPARRRTP